MHVPTLKMMFQFSDYVLRKNLEGITDEEALRAPDQGGNCLNWVLGHMVHSRNAILPVLGARPLFQREHFERYVRASPALSDAGEAIPLKELMDACDKLHEALMQALDQATDATFAQKAPFSPTENPDETVGSLMATIAFHEAYHSGQTGVLRRITGRKGVLGQPE